jgi:hypothetical protein
VARHGRIGFNETPHENQTFTKFRGYKLFGFPKLEGMRIFTDQGSEAGVALEGR